MSTLSLGGVASRVKEFAVRVKNWDLIVPPHHLRRGGRDLHTFVAAGTDLVRRCVRLAGLHAGSRLLDIGCGDGRFASCLTRVLKHGAYVGFDVNRGYAQFLSEHVTRRHPHFQFAHADVWHSYYNPRGVIRATDYRFPVDDASMDIIFLNSIFTHFLPDEISHYLTECRRVLRPGGVLLSTYFLITEESRRMDEQGLSDTNCRLEGGTRAFNHHGENYWSSTRELPERLVGIEDQWLQAAYADNQFQIERVVPGSWCGRPQVTDGTQQDIVVARKGTPAR